MWTVKLSGPGKDVCGKSLVSGIPQFVRRLKGWGTQLKATNLQVRKGGLPPLIHKAL